MWGRGLLRTPQWWKQCWWCRSLGTQDKLLIFYHRCAVSRCECHPSLSKVYAACISVSKYLKSFFPSVQNTYKTSLSSSLSVLGWSNTLLSPQPRAVALTETGLELPDLLQSSRIRSQQRSVWQWQRSIQLCNTPILLMHFTLSRLNCFGLLIYFSSSKQNNSFPPFPWQRVLPYAPNQLQPFWCFVTAHILGCIQKKKKNNGSLSISVSAPTKLKLKHSVH